ncbi:hypothetical protein KA005_04465 [bacterium]|nr:hypothetical protein [bacterium]
MPTWDLLDESFANLDDWVDGDNVNGESEISPAGELRLDGNIAAANNYARQYQDIGSFPDEFTAQVKLYHDLIGTYSDNNRFVLICNQADEKLSIHFSTSGLQIADTGSGLTTIGTNLVKSGGNAEWQIWRFNVTYGVLGAGICDVYLFDSSHNWEEVGSDIPCSTEDVVTDGMIYLSQHGFTSNDRLTHVDYIKAMTGHYAVYPSELYFSGRTEINPQSGIRIDRASNGDVRGQSPYSADRNDLILIHPAIDATNKALLDSFYTTNKILEFTLPWIDDTGYNYIFAGAPRYKLLGGSRYDATVPLAQKDE